MSTVIDVSGIKFDLDAQTKDYAIEKIGALDRFLPRHARKSASGDVKITYLGSKNGEQYEAEAILQLPGKPLVAKAVGASATAAVDEVEDKLTAQLQKYKDTHGRNQGVLARLKRSFAREQQ